MLFKIVLDWIQDPSVFKLILMKM